MKRFNTGDVIYNTRLKRVMVVVDQVSVDDSTVGCITMRCSCDSLNPERDGSISYAFVSYETDEINDYEILDY